MNWTYLSTKARVYIILISLWLTLALAGLIVSFVLLGNKTIDYWGCTLICGAFVAFPLFRFVYRMATRGFLAGICFWKVSVTEDDVYVSHDGWFLGFIVGIVAAVVALAVSPAVLIVYMIVYLVMVLRALFA